MVKHYAMKHCIFHTVETFTDQTVPDWLQSREYEWFFQRYVLNLEIGKSVATEFRTITRIE